ncbi:tubulin-specific chaperone C-like [Babylonia areolata]|uniref:tubulin-specific chaperone C-like n=1 Tax=Babylonia areolata TaxID=304850 RepID=UPI003FD1466C
MAAVDTADSQLQEKKLAITERLQKREEARLIELQKKKEHEGDTVSRQENVTIFLENLNDQRVFLEHGVAQSNNVTKTQLVDHFDDLSSTLHTLQRYVSECTAFLPSYEVRQAQETISNLQSMIQEKRDELLPKKKFAFSKAKKTNEKKVLPSKQENTTKIDEASAVVELAACKFVNQSGVSLSMDSSEINQNDVALVGLTDCTVKLFGSPSAVHIFKLKNCKIFAGPVSGSIFIRDCTNCVFVLPCQQLRIHNTFDTDFYIHVTSKAIIEDCARVQFAPYNWTYTNLDSDYQLSGLDRGRNNWDKVDDFNFLAADVASPNWSVLPEGKRTVTWN